MKANFSKTSLAFGLAFGFSTTFLAAGFFTAGLAFGFSITGLAFGLGFSTIFLATGLALGFGFSIVLATLSKKPSNSSRTKRPVKSAGRGVILA